MLALGSERPHFLVGSICRVDVLMLQVRGLLQPYFRLRSPRAYPYVLTADKRVLCKHGLTVHGLTANGLTGHLTASCSCSHFGLPGKPMARNYGPLSMNYGLL